MKASLFTLSTLLEAVIVTASPRNVIRRDANRNKSICGKTGYDLGTESFWGSNDGTYSVCSSACVQQKCKSFAYGAGECQLYDVSASSNFVAVDDSPYLFYDSSCISTTTSTTSTTSTIISKTTISTTTSKITTPASTTSAASSTSTVKSNGLACNAGSFDGSAPSGSTYTNYDQPTQEALDACYQFCLKNGCSGWEWSPNQCSLFSYKPVLVNWKGEANVGNYIYDKDCGAPVAASTTPASSTTTTAKVVATTKATTTSTKVMTTTASTTTSIKSTTTTTKATTTTTKVVTTTSVKSTSTTSSSSIKTSAQTTPKAISITTTTTTTKKLTTATTTSSASGTSSGFICGQQGYFSGSSGFHGYQTQYDQATQEALSQCYQYCVNSDEGYCAGWSWSPNNCVLFSYAPEGSHFQASSNDGTYVWDRRCGAPTASSAGN